MFQIEQSAIFLRQWKEFTHDYNKRAGKHIAVKFILAVEAAQQFIADNPYACAGYDSGGEFSYHQFSKWNLRGFPHIILFHLADKNLIMIDAIYAHKMDVKSRLFTNK